MAKFVVWDARRDDETIVEGYVITIGKSTIGDNIILELDTGYRILIPEDVIQKIIDKEFVEQI